ncbi:hypothetical protein ACI2US_03210 [Ralstonia nicotianae]|nr:hypothetical protein G7968_07510 [Ralstonia solanacearum]BCL97684.1 hypothetical protein MAFF211491_21360 [Ralstonia solanacearum]BCM13126.1 hypothetical protein MAFF241648_23160 [Ralstonia solanacearum]
MYHDPKTTAGVAVGATFYDLLNLPWAGIVSVLTAVYIVVQIIGALPKARDAIKELFK